MAKDDEKQTGNIFWIYFTFLSVVGLVYLAFWSFHNENLKGLAIAIIFSILIIFTHVFSRGEVFRLKGSFRKNAFWFTFAFFAWGAVIIWKKGQLMSTVAAQQVPGTFSLLNTIGPQGNQLLATISADLPQFWEFFTNQLVVPFIEEAFWIIAIPYAIIWIMDLAANEKSSLAWMANPVSKFVVALLVSCITFPIFHVQGIILVFIISAFMFRAVIMILYWGDELLDIFPDFRVAAAFAVGMHIANNWFDYGFIKGIDLLSQSVVGWLVLVSFAVILLAGLDYIIETPLNLVMKDES